MELLLESRALWGSLLVLMLLPLVRWSWALVLCWRTSCAFHAGHTCSSVGQLFYRSGDNRCRFISPEHGAYP